MSGEEGSGKPGTPTEGWYPDPERPPVEGIERYWDGTEWTARRRGASGEELDPPGWYKDPKAAEWSKSERYWDGAAWSEQRRNAKSAAGDLDAKARLASASATAKLESIKKLGVKRIALASGAALVLVVIAAAAIGGGSSDDADPSAVAEALTSSKYRFTYLTFADPACQKSGTSERGGRAVPNYTCTWDGNEAEVSADWVYYKRGDGNVLGRVTDGGEESSPPSGPDAATVIVQGVYSARGGSGYAGAKCEPKANAGVDPLTGLSFEENHAFTCFVTGSNGGTVKAEWQWNDDGTVSEEKVILGDE